MRLTYVGMMGLVLGLAAYGCSDDDGGGSGPGGPSTGGSDTGGSNTGGGDPGGSDSGGSDTGGTGALGGMGGEALGGMGGGHSGGYASLEEACTAWCQVLDDLEGADCDAAFEVVHGDLESCELTCVNESDDNAACEADWLAFVSCEAGASAVDFQCFPMFGISTAMSSPCFDLWQAADDCFWGDND